MANSKAKVSLKILKDGYTIIADGEEGEPVDWGEILEMETSDGRRFLACADAQGKEVESLAEFWAYEVLPVEDVPIIEADDEDEDEDEDGEGDEEEEEPEPAESPAPQA